MTLITPLFGIDTELTVIVPANKRECFYEVFQQDLTLEIEYEVLIGGDSDINYWFYSPTNRVLQSDAKKHDGHRIIKLEETGEYRFCFDNSFSRFTQKQVYFSLRSLDEHGKPDNKKGGLIEKIDPDQLGELQNKFEEIKVRYT